MSKNYFQNIHYNNIKAPFILKGLLLAAEFFYKNIINFKNNLYEKNILKEKKTSVYVICIGNLTTGGVGKTPIVAEFAKELSKENKVAIVQRGYKSKIKSKTPVVIKDYNSVKFKDGTLCGDEAYELSEKIPDNVVLVTSSDRYKAVNFLKEKFDTDIVILDDGFSNRKIQKNRTILVIDSKMRFGNNHLLPYGPLREPIDEIKRADEIIVSDKGDKDFDKNLEKLKNIINNPDLKISRCKMTADKIYNIQTKADIIVDRKNKKRIIAFCAIGQPNQFLDYLKDFYEVIYFKPFDDHHSYTKNDIKKLIQKAKELKVNSFITTQKDEAKIKNILPSTGYNFNVLELKHIIEFI